MVVGSSWHRRELWFVITRCSCLCTIDPWHSFPPRWSSDFMTAPAPDDRCHFNGLGFAPDSRCLATALGETDAPAGRRSNRRHGGTVTI
ncbi:DUF4915 domain-containing protein [Paludisphaera mucosa]|uniref:DUF4915 domain-containing protein n=1 Tax=Paludisphaera mucosa TaxID=3030827 RepID=A0ABT6F9U8_9BACT|nr:DUF4915 domain-containing protein [Paludisphaera mucosa]MDG3004365.1 DUF4915 domain-containing protein [Paludisphaera mucosa]